MMYLTAIFVPPIYFLIKKRWVGFVVTTGLFFLSLIFFIMVVLAPLGLILWGVSATCAVWNLRKELMHEHATIIAEKMAAKMTETMRQQQPAQPAPPPLPKA